ncbi:MAG: NDP-sugar synthase [Dehalococcoidia bacterium]|nr:NDP-sugar synthase [Dehalococcoidia bacterium]
MKAVILIGGKGTRLRPLTYSTPKAMVPVLNHPFLEHMFTYLKSHGIDEVILTLCYLPDQIRDYFGYGEKMGIQLTYVMETSPLGTAGAVKNAAEHLNDTFFVFNGDIFTDMDLTAMLRFHREQRATATIALTPVDDPSAFGVVETDKQHKIQRFVEKPKPGTIKSNMINAGTYILEPGVLEYIPHNTPFMFEHHLFPLLLEKEELLTGYPSPEGYWLDTGTPSKYLQLHQDLLGGKCRNIATVDTEVNSRNNRSKASIHSTARIGNKVIIGDNCVAERDSEIKNITVLGKGCHIGDGAIIENSILWQNVYVGQHSTVKNSILGNNCIIGNGVTANNLVMGDNERR